MAEEKKKKPRFSAPRGERFLTESEFHEEFVPTKDADGNLLDYDDVKNTPPEHVWSIVESGEEDDENWYALPGFHVVNVVGYVTSVFPSDETIAEAIYFDAEDFADENDDDD